MKDEIRWGKIFAYAGAFIAFLIGSGFATGQEVLQYFSSYGYAGMLGVLVCLLLFLYVGAEFMLTGHEQKFDKGNDIFKYYCGNIVGTFYDYFSIAFIYMSFIVMIGGAGATINQQYGLPVYFGGILIGVLAVVTVLMGLNRLVDILGKIGPIIVVLTIVLGVLAVLKKPEGIIRAGEIIPNLNLLTASSNWFFAAGSYVGFCMLWLAAFMSALGATSISKKEAVMGSSLGALGFCLGLLIITLGIMANIETLAGTMVPSLILAEGVHPALAVVFSFIVVAGIYTTSVPLLWQVSARFAKEKTKKFIVITLILAVVGVFVGLRVPFDKLVNIIYVINGYVGILLLAFMVAKRVLLTINKSSATDENSL